MARRPVRRAGRERGRSAGPETKRPVPVVAIGASAGGLDPICQFLAAMPAESGLAFVVIQHLDPSAKSMLVELLGKQTGMPVRVARDGLQVQADEVYVIAPGTHLTIAEGVLRTAPVDRGSGVRMQVDGFFHSLAATQGYRAVGIVMSGTGTDGTMGLLELKASGGLTLAQDPEEATHDGMPRHAIVVAGPDHVLRVRDMPAAIMRFVRHDYVRLAPEPGSAEEADAGVENLSMVLATLRMVTGRNFEQYKTGTIRRRVERRMALNAVSDWSQYRILLRESPAEADALVKDLMINVTGFFRDPAAFAELAEQVLPGLLAGRGFEQPLRVWVPGCSTGEEAYSIAILLAEKISAAHRRIRFQIFATDIDEEALHHARNGVYPDTIRATVGQERLDRFFVAVEHGYKIANGVRQSVIFSRHDLLSDPPFSRIDLISCRNLFIYIKPEVQMRALQLFHFALNMDGALFLGSSETIGTTAGLFEPIDRKQRIYRRIGGPRHADAGLPPLGERPWSGPSARPGQVPQQPIPILELARRIVLESFAPASVVVDRKFAGLHYLGPIDQYLRVAPGEVGQNILATARDGLRPRLRETIERAFRSKRRIVTRGISVRQDLKTRKITIDARRILRDDEDTVLVCFVDEPPAAAAARVTGKAQQSAETKKLRRELEDTQEELNQTIRDLETVNEEMKAANEEAMSMNEEFLSTNEELETSKEELQSLNEELTTLNAQLNHALEQQQEASANLQNLLNSSDVATIFLDRSLNIRFFNPPMSTLLSVLDKDIGRPLTDLVQKFADPEFTADANAALTGKAPPRREIRAHSGQWYLRSITPFVAESGAVDGVVVTFTDVSPLKHMESAAVGARSYAEAVIETARIPLLVIDDGLRIVSANPAFRAMFQPAVDKLEGRRPGELGIPIFQTSRWIGWADRLPTGAENTDELMLDVEAAGGANVALQVMAHTFRTGSPERRLFLLAFLDATARLHIVRRQLHLILDALPEAVVEVDRDGRICFVNAKVEPMFGYRPDELIGRTIEMLVPEDARARHERVHAEYLRQPTMRRMGTGLDIQGVAKDGRRLFLDIALCPIATADGTVFIAAIHDVSLTRRSQAELREARAVAERASDAKSRFLAAVSHDLRQPLQAMSLLLGVLEKHGLDAAARGVVAQLDEPIRSMTNLLDTLLDVNQIETGLIKPELAEFSIASLLARKAREFAPLAAAKGLALRMVPSNVVVRSDLRLLERMLDNLLSNAIKYTERGKILLGCRRRGPLLRIEVWDTGPGIPPEDRDRIFEEFYRPDRPGAPSGLGLGLYIVKRFADALGHGVELRTASGKGTCFALAITVGRAQRARPPADAVAPGPGNGRPRILLVEDDRTQLETLGQLLTLHGCHVMAAPTADAAMALCRAPGGSRPDVIVADYNLRGPTTGLQVIQNLRAEWASDIPGLVVSGDRTPRAREAFRDQDLVPVLKPVKPAELLSALDALIATLKPGWRPAPGPVRVAPAAGRTPAGGADICVVDDDPGVREAMRVMLETAGHSVATHASAEALLAGLGTSSCRCLVVDVGLPGMNGLELQDRLKQVKFDVPVIFVTGAGDLPTAVEAMRQGAADFLQKPVRPADLQASVERVLNAATAKADGELAREDIEAHLAKLTERERQVLDRLVLGQPNKIIAAELGISQRTVEHHRQSVMRKMEARSLATLVRMTALR